VAFECIARIDHWFFNLRYCFYNQNLMEEQQQSKQTENFKVIGGNLLIMVAYTILSRFSGLGGILDCMFLLIHVLTCWGLSLSKKSWVWFLAGLLVLLIGASTCVSFL